MFKGIACLSVVLIFISFFNENCRASDEERSWKIGASNLSNNINIKKIEKNSEKFKTHFKELKNNIKLNKKLLLIADEKENIVQEIKKVEGTNLIDVEDYVKDLLKSKSKIPIILLDFDGTITDHSNPKEDTTVGYRGNALNFLLYLIDNKVDFIISSASEFNRMIKRFKKLDSDGKLVKALGLEGKDIEQGKMKFGTEDVESIYWCFGEHIASIHTPFDDSFVDESLDKAYTISLIYSEILSDVTDIVFADDTYENVVRFEEQIKNIEGLSKDVVVKTFTLSRVKGEKGTE